MNGDLPEWVHQRDGALREVSLPIGESPVSDWVKVLLYLTGHGQLDRVTAMPPDLERRFRHAHSLRRSELAAAMTDALALQAASMDWVVNGSTFRFYLWDDTEVAFGILPDPRDQEQLATLRGVCESLASLFGRSVTIRHEHGDYPPVVLSP
ncbi:MAG: hypothetical protein ACI8PZ_007126 [Myxococcota bacterium]